jgi:hypothetical protein
MRLLWLGLVLGALLTAGGASATTITLSTVSSDLTPTSQLDATLDFSVVGTTLTLTAANTGVDFNVNGIYFNGSDDVTTLTLLSATHSAAGDVLAAWAPIELGSSADGFGAFDYAITDGVGETNVNILNPGEDVVFVFTVNAGLTDSDFIVPNGSGYYAAAKFVNGPDDPESPGNEDSAFGAVPEPATLVMLSGGLVGLLALRRRNLRS